MDTNLAKDALAAINDLNAKLADALNRLAKAEAELSKARAELSKSRGATTPTSPIQKMVNVGLRSSLPDDRIRTSDFFKRREPK